MAAQKKKNIGRLSVVAKRGIYKEDKKELKNLEEKAMDEKNTPDDKKFVTIEMFEQYHKRLMEYIGMHDDLILNGETTCPKCGATITSDKCDKCADESEVEE